MRGRTGWLVGRGLLPDGGVGLALACPLLVKCFYVPTKHQGAEECPWQQGAGSVHPSLTLSGVTAALRCPSLCTKCGPTAPKC